jgi:hypothetical protein
VTIKAGEKKEEVFTSNLPVLPTENRNLDHNCHPFTAYEKIVSNQFTTSVTAKLFKIEFFLAAYIKHSSSMLKGNFVRIPVKIMYVPSSFIATTQPMM